MWLLGLHLLYAILRISNFNVVPREKRIEEIVYFLNQRFLSIFQQVYKHVGWMKTPFFLSYIPTC